MDLKTLAGQIVGGHKILAVLTGNQLWVITDKEGEALAKAVSDVMQYHQISINPQAAAYAKLITVCLAIYGPKAFVAYKMIQAKKPAPQQTPPEVQEEIPDEEEPITGKLRFT